MDPDTFTIVRGIVAQVLGITEEQVAPEDTVASLTAQYCREEPLPPEPEFCADIGAKSMNIVGISMALEEAFSLKVPYSDIERITSRNGTVREIAEFV